MEGGALPLAQGVAGAAAGDALGIAAALTAGAVSGGLRATKPAATNSSLVSPKVAAR